MSLRCTIHGHRWAGAGPHKWCVRCNRSAFEIAEESSACDRGTMVVGWLMIAIVIVVVLFVSCSKVFAQSPACHRAETGTRGSGREASTVAHTRSAPAAASRSNHGMPGTNLDSSSTEGRAASITRQQNLSGPSWNKHLGNSAGSRPSRNQARSAVSFPNSSDGGDGTHMRVVAQPANSYTFDIGGRAEKHNVPVSWSSGSNPDRSTIHFAASKIESGHNARENHGMPGIISARSQFNGTAYVVQRPDVSERIPGNDAVAMPTALMGGKIHLLRADLLAEPACDRPAGVKSTLANGMLRDSAGGRPWTRATVPGMCRTVTLEVPPPTRRAASFLKGGAANEAHSTLTKQHTSGIHVLGRREAGETLAHTRSAPAAATREKHWQPGIPFERGQHVATGQIRREPSGNEYRPHGGSPTALILSALSEIESGHNPNAIGRAGERGRYQITRAAWVESGRTIGCRCAFKPNAHTAHADAHAAAYYRHIYSRLATSFHRNPTPAETYAVWNTGTSGFKRCGLRLSRCPAATRDAALRFENLLRQPASPPPSVSGNPGHAGPAGQAP